MHDAEAHRRADGRDALGPPRAARARLHRCLGRRRSRSPGPARPGRRAMRQGELLYPTLMFRVDGVDAARAGDAWRRSGRAMLEAAARGRHRFARKGAILRPMKHAERMARQCHPDPQRRGRAMDGTDARAAPRRRDRGRRQVRDFLRFLRAGAGFRGCLHRSTSRRRWASARRGACSAHYRADGRGRARLRRFDDSIGVNGWPME